MSSTLHKKAQIDNEYDMIIRELKGRNILHDYKDPNIEVNLNNRESLPSTLDLVAYESEQDSSEFSEDSSLDSRFQLSANFNPDTEKE